MRAFPELEYIIPAAGFVAPVCILQFIRRAVISVPLAMIVSFACMSHDDEPVNGIVDWLCMNLFFSFIYVWLFYGWQRVHRWQLKAPVAPANQTLLAFWRWALLCALTCNATLVAIFILQACRGYDYLDYRTFPIRAIFVERALIWSSGLSFVASPLLLARCGTLALISWLTVVGTLAGCLVWGPLYQM